MDKKFSDVVDLIYASAQSSSLFSDAIGRVAEFGGGFAAHYIKVDTSSRTVLESVISDPMFNDTQAAYSDYFVAVDPRLSWLGSGHCGEWRFDQTRFDEHFVRHNELYNDFLLPNGAKRAAFNVVGQCNGTVELIGVIRACEAGDFTAENETLLTSLSTHLVRAASLRARISELEVQQAAAHTTLEHLPYGAFWLDASQRIVWMSPPAQAYLVQNDGLKAVNDKLVCHESATGRRLEEALKRATKPQGRQGMCLAIPRTRQASPWLVSVIPAELPPDHGAQHRGPFALVILQDGAGQSLPHARQLQMLYGLTPAEARLALGLLQNETLESYAELHHISRETCRTHLKRLFAKTGSRRQAELQRILALPLPRQPD